MGVLPGMTEMATQMMKGWMSRAYGKTISTVGRERRANPALQLSAEAFALFQTEKLPALPADFQTIKRRNLGYA